MALSLTIHFHWKSLFLTQMCSNLHCDYATAACNRGQNNTNRVILGAKKLIGEKHEGVLADISTLSYPIFVKNKNAYHSQTRPHLKLKTLPGFPLFA
jgi:hypothetical protein